MALIDMKDIIITDETVLYGKLISGEVSIIKNHPNFLPTAIDNLVTEKAERDKESIENGLRLLEYYISNGLTDYNPFIERLLSISKDMKK